MRFRKTAIIIAATIAVMAIIGRVIEAQSLGVDTVSGVTHSSLTILMAIQNALEEGTQP